MCCMNICDLTRHLYFLSTRMGHCVLKRLMFTQNKFSLVNLPCYLYLLIYLNSAMDIIATTERLIKSLKEKKRLSGPNMCWTQNDYSGGEDNHHMNSLWFNTALSRSGWIHLVHVQIWIPSSPLANLLFCRFDPGPRNFWHKIGNKQHLE